MRVILFALVTAACLAAQPNDDAVKKELKHFQGKWTLVSGQSFNGENLTAGETMVIKGNKFTIGKDTEGTFTIDPTKKPRTIDVALTKPVEWKLLGIYEIDGDTRKSCFAEEGKPRPDGFRKEKGFVTLEWKRAK